jgi:hypothetical protein
VDAAALRALASARRVKQVILRPREEAAPLFSPADLEQLRKARPDLEVVTRT